MVLEVVVMVVMLRHRQQDIYRFKCGMPSELMLRLPLLVAEGVHTTYMVRMSMEDRLPLQ